MPEFTIIEAKAHHCGQMVRRLRHEHNAVIARFGINSHQSLRERFDQSSFRRAWMIDGKLAALGGVTGTKMSSQGYIWLALGDEALRYPKAIVREARKQLAEIMLVKRDLVTTILDGDAASQRFAIFMGFVPMGEQWVTQATSRFGRREMARRCEATEGRMSVGLGTAIAMKYQPEGAPPCS